MARSFAFLALLLQMGVFIHSFRSPSRFIPIIPKKFLLRQPKVLLDNIGGDNAPDSASSENNGLKWPQFSSANFFGGALIGGVGVILALFLPFVLNFDDINMEIGSRAEPSVVSSFQGKSAAEESREAVSLFEDILTDLRLGYVDEVDPKKLFETGVSAMLRSLDPYTEFENVKAAQGIQESVSGKYGGVGLVITNTQPAANAASPSTPLPMSAQPTSIKPESKSNTEQSISSTGSAGVTVASSIPEKSAGLGSPRPPESGGSGVTVVDAFEGYAFKNGMRVGDHILAVDGVDATGLTVEGVRDLLRGDPETSVNIKFEREEFAGRNQYERVLQRKQVKLSDVRLACFLGNSKDGIGYINLSGFNAGAGRDFRSAFLMLKYLALEGPAGGLKGVVLDLRSNPGGLLDAAVEIASYVVPSQADIVSARSRGGPEIVYRSIAEPIRSPETKLVVLVNSGSASASEIVAGAVQDLDAGVVMGQSKTYGKGLVQKILPLPYDSALKYTIARYYTPSGRCIQAVNYSGGREVATASSGASEMVDSEEAGTGGTIDLRDGAKTVADADRKTFYTQNGRPVLDGGGINPDVTVPPNALSPSEALFLREGLYSRYISKYIETHNILPTLQNLQVQESVAREEDPRYNHGAFGSAVEQFLVLDSGINAVDAESGLAPSKEMYRGFKSFVQEQMKTKKLDFKLAAIPKLEGIKKTLQEQGLTKAASELERVIPRLSEDLIQNMEENKQQVSNSLELALLSREFPDRLLLYRAIKDDPQIDAARKLMLDEAKARSGASPYEALLAGTGQTAASAAATAN